MKSVQVQLLESLGSGVRPFDTSEAQRVGDDAGFTHLLRDAINGRPETDLGVRFGPNVSGEFNEVEQRTIARAVDRAAASGVEQALILHNQRTLRVDVRNRMVLEAMPISDPKAITEIDGFVSSTFEQEKGRDDGRERVEDGAIKGAISPARIVRNASLVHALAGRVSALD